MYKYSIGLVTAFILFTGCGGGEKGPVTPKLDTLNAQSNTSALEATLRKAGFNAASDVVTLQKDTIAFTYYDNEGTKHFVVYDSKNGDILSNIAHFKGQEVLHNNTTQNVISFKNGTVVNTNNYAHAQADYSKINNKSSTNTNYKARIENQLPNGQYISQFIYSPQKQGAAVLVKNAGGIVGLYLYGLTGSSPVRELNMYPLLEDGEEMYNIQFPKSGEVTFTINHDGWKYFYSYNYLSKKLSQLRVVTPDGQQNTNNSQQTQSGEEAIRAQIAMDEYRTIKDFIYTSDNHSDAAVVISRVGGNASLDFLLYDIPTYGAPYKVYDVFPPEGYDEEWVSFKNLKRIGGGKITFTATSRGENGYQTRDFTYYYLQHRYEGSYSNVNYNTNLSMEQLIRQKMDNDGGYVRDYVEFNSINRAVITSKKPSEQWEISVYDTSDPSRAHWLYTIGYYDNISDVYYASYNAISFRADGSDKTYDISSRSFSYSSNNQSSSYLSMEQLIRQKMDNDGGYVRDYEEFNSINRAVITSKKPNEKWEISVYDTSDPSRAHWLYTIGYYNNISDVYYSSYKTISFRADGSSKTYDISSRSFVANDPSMIII